MEHDPLQRLPSLRNDKQASRLAAGDEGLLDRATARDELLLGVEEVRVRDRRSTSERRTRWPSSRLTAVESLRGRTAATALAWASKWRQWTLPFSGWPVRRSSACRGRRPPTVVITSRSFSGPTGLVALVGWTIPATPARTPVFALATPAFVGRPPGVVAPASATHILS
jgi:hypothetical protein